MSNLKKITKATMKTTLDVGSGEILQLEGEETYIVEREPEYIKMYISDIARLSDIPKGMDDILMAFIKNMGYNNIIPVYMPIKKMIARDLDCSVDYINKAIQCFYKKGVFIRADRGLYLADPNLFARGSWKDVRDLRLTIDYSGDKKKLKSNLPEQMQLKLGF
jgi:hypothetical protein|tara:strand:+ start:178 stop:666 length:489 start_codon:yes stop_codon:yes gene_type:complete